MTRRQSSKRFLQRLTASCLICTLSWGPPLASLANDITPDGATRTTIDQAQNGVRVVNIAPATQGGVSHNKYTDFNVRQTGAIMNNSRQVGVSQLGGALPANPHYSDRTAQIILNEVTSNNRSQLKGYTEIFGDRAEFILANPNGITCSGCGFINTSRLGLVTGTPQLDEIGRLDGLAIGQGDVLIEGLGLNAENVRYVDIVTRLAKIQGELVAGEELNIHTGNGRFDYKTRTVSSDPNAAATGATFAVDASALGRMYAGRIKIISSEAGLGVRNDAKLVANVDDLVITAQGDIAYADARAKRDMKVQAKGNITQTKRSQAGNDLRINAGKTIDLSGDSAQATAALHIQGNTVKLHGASKAAPLKVAARTANLSGKQGVQLARTRLQADETATLQSEQGDVALSQESVSANRLTITAARNITNEDHLAHAGQALTLRAIAGNIENRNAGSLWSKGTLSANAGNMVENKGLVRSTGDMKIVAGGALNNTGDAKQSGLMVTDAALTLEAEGAFANRGGAIAAQSAVVKAQSITFHHAGQTTQGGLIVGGDMTLTAKGALRNTGQIIKTDGNLSATAQSLANSNDGNTIGEMRATGTMDLGVTNDLANQGLIYAAGALDMTVGGAVTNTGDAKKTGLVLSKAALTLNANAALTNQGGVISAQSAVIGARSIQLRAIPGNTDVGGLLFGGDATLTTVDDLDNQGQQINTQGALSITARSLSNRNNGQMVGKLRSGQAMDIHISQGLTNEGYLYASKTLTAKAGGALINRGNSNDTGILLSDGALTIDADGALESRGGIIAAQSAVLRARSVLLDRTGQTTDRGGLSTKADASLVVTTGFTNNGQRVSAGRNLTIDAADIVNQSGAGQIGKLHATGRLSLTSGAGLTNRGRIEGAGVSLKTRATVSNIGDGKNSGILAAGDTLTLDITGNLDNHGILSSKGNSTITLSGRLLNAAKRISVGGDLKLTATTLDNSGGGEIEIGGDLTTVEQLTSVDNRSGRLKGLTAGKTLALNMRTLRNEGGNIASNGSVSLVIDADYDLKGAFSAGQTLAVQARGLRNYTRLDAGEMLRLTASGNFSNETGAVLASDQDIEITAGQAIVNNSEITSGRSLKLHAKGGNLTNEAGAKVTGGSGTTTLIASSSVINRNKLSSGQGHGHHCHGPG
uniref:Filamentous hemagglutinin family N-terminal domain-containing protein n=1 Tax=Candidatus Kentrum sp. UNK TaxID=2126344 RepID=A0A451AV63_9GAMM|nr:MAG: filamentous hemagglutinin family N-terminal domain-containing protein [Candidatus Kentron sp. UNK]VFK69923.1 MAG: filamentous hemagglutinin family N-terminal domain-containing protein [Candidatus Kentron sp. UNK]